MCVCVCVCASEKFSLNEFSTNAGRITMRLEWMVDLTMLKWFLMETALGLASFPGCRPQIRICSSTANEKKIKLTSGGKYPRANPKISKQPHRSDEILIPTDQILHEVTKNRQSVMKFQTNPSKSPPQQSSLVGNPSTRVRQYTHAQDNFLNCPSVQRPQSSRVSRRCRSRTAIALNLIEQRVSLREFV